LYEQGDHAGAGRRLYQVYLGEPGNRELAGPEMRKLKEQAEAALLKPDKIEEMESLKAELYFILDRKNYSSEVTAMGRAFLNPENPDEFLPAGIEHLMTFVKVDETKSLDEQEQ